MNFNYFNTENKLIKSQLCLLKELAKGKTLRDTALNLHISYYNLQKRTQLLYKKFNVHTRKELIIKAIERKIISTKDVSIKFRKRFIKVSNKIDFTAQNLNYKLSPQEQAFLFLAGKGKKEYQIRNILNLKGKYHSHCIKELILWKLNSKNMAEAIIKYYKLENI